MSGLITTSYGRCAMPGFLYGAGYGKDDKLSKITDKAAEMLVKSFGMSVEKRGNSDGNSCGAFHDMPQKGNLIGACIFGLCARIDDKNKIIYNALLHIDYEKVEYAGTLGLKIDQASSRFDPYIYKKFNSLREAARWLVKYAPILNDYVKANMIRRKRA